MAAGSDWTKAITMAFEEQLLHWRLNPLQLTTGSSKTHLHCIDDNRNAANGYRRVLLPHSAAQRSTAQHITVNLDFPRTRLCRPASALIKIDAWTS